MDIRRRLFACLLAVAGAGAAEPPPQGSGLDGVPNVDVQYYDVAGRSFDEIRNAMNAARPTEANDGQRVDALTRWYLRWRWPRQPDGTCLLDRVEVTFSATMQMPRLADPAHLPRQVLARWQAYMAALQIHEQGHVRHAWENMESVARAIRASDCANATAAGRAATRALARWDVDYDRQTRHGLSQGARFP
jgi:predicted secreted Zn-dependent protease